MKLNKSEIKQLQDIIMGRFFNESILNKALIESDSLEVTICLRAEISGQSTWESSMRLQEFVCRLSRAA
jgi:hypothetical protein